MKPKTSIQKEVARLNARLPQISEAQKRYAFRHCFEPIGRRSADGRIVCTECGQSWQGGGALSETLCGARCPHCGTELKIENTRRRVFRETAYYGIMTTCKGYQVLRFFLVKANRRVGQPAAYHIYEVVSRWIAPDGRNVTLSRSRGIAFLYYDLWIEDSPMEVRRRNHRSYDILPACIYPRVRYIAELKRNGFTGDFHRIPPFDLFTSILSMPPYETLLKAGQIPMLRYMLQSSASISEYWDALKICLRHGYIIPDGAVWRDYIDTLRYLGKDIRNTAYVCPENLADAHDRAVAKRKARCERERLEEKRRTALAAESRYFLSVSRQADKESSKETGVPICDKRRRQHRRRSSCAFPIQSHHLRTSFACDFGVLGIRFKGNVPASETFGGYGSRSGPCERVEDDAVFRRACPDGYFHQLFGEHCIVPFLAPADGKAPHASAGTSFGIDLHHSFGCSGDTLEFRTFAVRRQRIAVSRYRAFGIGLELPVEKIAAVFDEEKTSFRSPP